MKKLLILDLDETLIHATRTPLDCAADYISDDGMFYYKRPYSDMFIDFVRKYFDVAIWSSSEPRHIQQCLSLLFAKDASFAFVWSYKDCERVCLDAKANSYCWRKDLNKLSAYGYDLARVIVVDDSVEKLDQHLNNLIRIKAFFGGQGDIELLRVMKFLHDFRRVKDVTVVEKSNWELWYNESR